MLISPYSAIFFQIIVSIMSVQQKELDKLIADVIKSNRKHQKSAELYTELQSIWSDINLTNKSKCEVKTSKTSLATTVQSESCVNLKKTSKQKTTKKVNKRESEPALASQSTSVYSGESQEGRTLNLPVFKRLKHERELYDNLINLSEGDVKHRINFLNLLEKRNQRDLKTFTKHYPEISEIREIMEGELKN